VVKALSADNKPANVASYKAWLFAILRNTFFDRIRQQKRHLAYLDEAAADELQGLRPSSVEDSLINRITVRSGMEQLSDPHREIISLIDLAGFSYAEAAELLAMPVGTVMSRLNRARQSLLEKISASDVHVLDTSLQARRKSARS